VFGDEEHDSIRCQAHSKDRGWVRAAPSLVRFIGAAEVLAALGLILAIVTNILPWLTVAAGVGLALIMVSAATFHLSRGEASRVPVNAVLPSWSPLSSPGGG
jgi:hypothetical protein